MYSVQKHTCCGCNGLVLGLGSDCVLKGKHPSSYGFADLIMTAQTSYRVFTANSPSLWRCIISSSLPQLCGITGLSPGPSGEQWGSNEDESPGISFQGLAELACNE